MEPVRFVQHQQSQNREVFFRAVTGIEMRPKWHFPEFRRSHSVSIRTIAIAIDKVIATAHTPSQPMRSLRRDIPRFLPLTGPYLASHPLSGCRLPRDCRYIHAVSPPKIHFGQGATSVVPSPGLLAPSDLSFSLFVPYIPMRHVATTYILRTSPETHHPHCCPILPSVNFCRQ